MTRCPWCDQPHRPSIGFDVCPVRDDLAIAYWAGRIDARNGRPPTRRPTHDMSPTAVAYRRGHQHQLEQTAVTA